MGCPPHFVLANMGEAWVRALSSAPQVAAMESQTVPSKMLKFLVGAMQSVLDEVGLRYVRFCTRLGFVPGTPLLRTCGRIA